MTQEQIDQIAKKYWRDANVRTITEAILIKIAREAYDAGRGAADVEKLAREIDSYYAALEQEEMQGHRKMPKQRLTEVAAVLRREGQ